MSYILDALKKSEQERGHGNIPDVQTVHSSSLNYDNQKKTYWPYILITVAVLNLLAIVYFIANRESPPQIIAATQPATTDDGAANKTETDKKERKTQTKPETAVDTEAEPVAINNKKIIATKTVAAENPAPQQEETVLQVATKTDKAANNAQAEIIDYYDLPESIKSELPAIIITAHVYSSTPSQRSIVINNNFMEEGEYVLDGLVLYEITPDGAVFDYQGTLFNYAVVSGWQ